MIQAHDLFIQYGDRILFDGISFSIKTVDKIGLIGRNGVGKTTLFQILSHTLVPDRGTIRYPKETKIGYLSQSISLDTEETVIAETKKAFAQIEIIKAENSRLEEKISRDHDYESKSYQKALDKLQHNYQRLHQLEAEKVEEKTERVLKGLGFTTSDLEKEIYTLSGGWQMRIQLAKLLLQGPDLLLLDEPTNHLDIEAIIWLEEYLKNYPNSVVLISHDKEFLKNTCTRILELENSKLTDYSVSYEKYEKLKEERQIQLEAAYKNQQRVIAEKERTISRFMAKATKTSMAQSMQRQLDKMERIELDPTSAKHVKIRFLPIPRSSRTVLKANKIGKSFGDKIVLKNISMEVERGDRIAIVGQNGQGKTTLARLLLNELPLSSGEIKHGSNLEIGYYAQNQADSITDSETLLEYMEMIAPEGMHTRVRSILGAFLFSGEDVDKKIKVLSGGEKSRLAFAQMLMKPINLLVLDEPTNHLDMISKEVLKQALLDYEGTLIVVSHDRDFLSGLTTKTIELRDQTMFTYLGDVNYFLEKRKLDTLRQVAMHKTKTTEEPSNFKKNDLDYNARKEIKRRIQSSEKKVMRLEQQILKLEEEMSKDNFYNQPNALEKLNQHRELKKKLEQAEAAWESVVSELDEDL